jgi:hypothetical protein
MTQSGDERFVNRVILGRQVVVDNGNNPAANDIPDRTNEES